MQAGTQNLISHKDHLDGGSNFILIIIITVVSITISIITMMMRWKEEAAILLHRQPWASLMADA